MGQRVRKSFFGGRGIAQARSRPWVSRGVSDLVARTLPIRGRYTLQEICAIIASAPTTWAGVPTASSPPTVTYGGSYETPDTTKLGGVSWKRYWFRGDNGQPENTGGGRTLLQRAAFDSFLTQGPAFGGGVNYNNNSGNSTEWWQSYQNLLRAGQDEADLGNFSGWSWGFTLTGRGFAISGQSYTDAVVYVEEGGVLKRCPYQDRPNSDTYAYFDFGTSATRNILLVIPPVGWSSEIIIPTTATMVPWSGWRTGRLAVSIMGDSYFQDVYITDGCPSGEQFSMLMGGGPTPSVSAHGGSGYASDNSDPVNVRAFNFPHRLNRAAVGQPDLELTDGGINDGWPTTTTSAGSVSTAQAIDKVLRDKRRRNPPGLMVYGSPWAPNGPNGQNPSGKYQQINNYLQTALAKDPEAWIFVDSLNGTWKTFLGTQRSTAEGPWITGTGNTGSPNGTGNADIYVGPDGTHLSNAGRRYVAEKNSQYVHEAAASMVLSLAAAAQVLDGVSQSASATAAAGALTASAVQLLDGVSQAAAVGAVAGAVAAQSLAPVSNAAAASAQAGAAAAQVLAGVGQTASAAAQDRISAAQTLQATGQAATAAAVGSAAAAQTLAAVGQASAAGVSSASAAAQALAPVSQAATASAAASATSARTLAGVAQAAAGAGVASASAGQQLQGVSQAAGAGVVPSGIVAAQTLAPVSQGAAAAARANAAASQALVAAVNLAAVAALDAVQAVQQLTGVTQAATAEKAAQVVAQQILEAVGQSAEAQRLEVRAVSAAQALANVAQLAALQPGGAPEPVYGAIPAGRQRSYPSRPAVVSARRPANVQGRSW